MPFSIYAAHAPPKGWLVVTPRQSTPPSLQRVCTHHHQHQGKPQAMLPNTPLRYATSFPSRVGWVEVEPGEGHRSRRSWLPSLLACWADRSGPRGRGQGWPFYQCPAGLHPPPPGFLSQQTEREAATGCKGGLGVILGCRARRLPRMAGGGVGGGLGPGNSEAPLTKVRKGRYKLRPRWWRQIS